MSAISFRPGLRPGLTGPTLQVGKPDSATPKGSFCQPRQRAWVRVAFFLTVALAGPGCQQKMAQGPYYKPLEESDFFPDHRSARPLEPGVVHRAQHLDSDPLVTGLTQGEWTRFWNRDTAANGKKEKVDVTAATPPEDRDHGYGAPRFDPPGFKPAAGGTPHPGPQIYVNEYPFEITARDLSIGADRFTTYCAPCHGPLGNGKGKIWERGFLKPTSFHTEKVEPAEPDETAQIPLGISRGYWKWDIHIPLREVPVGYIFEVITKGYGQMPDYAAQIKAEDRWRIIAYIRTLQYTEHPAMGTDQGNKK